MKPGRAHIATASRSPSSIAAVAAVAAMLLGFLGFLYGLHCNFFRSSVWTQTSIAATALIMLPITFALMTRAFRTGLKGARVTVFRVLMIASLLFVLLGLAMFFIVAYTLPDLYTRMTGQPIEIRGVEFSKARSFGRGGCRYTVRAAAFARGSVRGHYCAGPNEFDALPQSGVARAYARQSWFGRHVDSIEPADPSWTR
jgi:hypothetical protein